MGPFEQSGGYTITPSSDYYGQQVCRGLDDFGSYLYQPRSVAAIHLRAICAILGAEEDYPNWFSQDLAYVIRAGGGPHGGQTFHRLLPAGQRLVEHERLTPLLAAAVPGLSDLTAEGLLISHWLPLKNKPSDLGFLGISHWNFPGAVVLPSEDAVALLQSAGSEETKAKLRAIRVAITSTVQHVAPAPAAKRRGRPPKKAVA